MAGEKSLLMGAAQWVHFRCLNWSDAIFHPEDRALRRRLVEKGDVGECIFHDDGEHIGLQLGTLSVRLRSDHITSNPIAKPAFVFGDTVRVTSGRTARIGTVRRIIWHTNLCQPVFYISQDGKRIKNRYLEEELELVVE